MRHHRARQPPAADRTRPAAIDLGHAADHAQIGKQCRGHVGEGDRHDRRRRRHGPRRRLDLAPRLLVEPGEQLRLGRGQQGFGIVARRPRLAQPLAPAGELGPGGIEPVHRVGRPPGEGEVALRQRRGGVAVDGVEAAQAAEGQELAQGEDQRRQGEEGEERHPDPAEQRVARQQIVDEAQRRDRQQEGQQRAAGIDEQLHRRRRLAPGDAGDELHGAGRRTRRRSVVDRRRIGRGRRRGRAGPALDLGRAARLGALALLPLLAPASLGRGPARRQSRACGSAELDQHRAAAPAFLPAHSRSPIRNSAARSRRICGGPSPGFSVEGAGAKSMIA